MCYKIAKVLYHVKACYKYVIDVGYYLLNSIKMYLLFIK